MKGRNFKSRYLKEAINGGAKFIVSEKPLKKELNSKIGKILVTDINSAMAIAGDMYYESPYKKINIIGITGTKGKSSTAFLTKFILDGEQAEDNVGITSSIKNYYGEEEEKANLTTPEAIDLSNYLHTSVKNNLEHFVMEVSSQGLKKGRLTGINFDIGCFLNFGEDHISEFEHPTLEDYYQSKKKLIIKSKCAIINIDIPQHKDIIREAIDSPYNEKIITFGSSERADVYGYDLKETEKGIFFKVKTKDFNERIHLPIKGKFNFDNALCAIAIAVESGITKKQIKKGLENAKIEGRMEFHTINDKEILLDYAHNELSYRALKEFIESNYKGRVIYTVFGCAGERGKNRRKIAGNIIGSFSDKAYIVSHKPGNEDPKVICEQISEGFIETNSEY